VVLALVLAAGIALAWRAHALAQSTHDILLQILENQAKAQTAKGGKRRSFTSRTASANRICGSARSHQGLSLPGPVHLALTRPACSRCPDIADAVSAAVDFRCRK